MSSPLSGVNWLVALALVLSAEGLAHADEKDDNLDHTFIVGVGGAAELELGDGSLHAGANLMVEWDAIENWLELEIGASVLTATHGVEIPVVLLVKKPFELARWVEFMVGIGPEVVQLTGTNKGTYFGGEVALDFMFWPWGRHRATLESRAECSSGGSAARRAPCGRPRRHMTVSTTPPRLATEVANTLRSLRSEETRTE